MSDLFKRDTYTSDDQKVSDRIVKLAQFAQVAYNSTVKFPMLKEGQKPETASVGFNTGMGVDLATLFVELLRGDIRTGELGRLMGKGGVC